MCNYPEKEKYNFLVGSKVFAWSIDKSFFELEGKFNFRALLLIILDASLPLAIPLILIGWAMGIGGNSDFISFLKNAQGNHLAFETSFLITVYGLLGIGLYVFLFGPVTKEPHKLASFLFYRPLVQGFSFYVSSLAAILFYCIGLLFAGHGSWSDFWRLIIVLLVALLAYCSVFVLCWFSFDANMGDSGRKITHRLVALFCVAYGVIAILCSYFINPQCFVCIAQDFFNNNIWWFYFGILIPTIAFIFCKKKNP